MKILTQGLEVMHTAMGTTIRQGKIMTNWSYQTSAVAVTLLKCDCCLSEK